MTDDVSLTQAEYALILRGHAWIRSVDPHASLSRGWTGILVDLLDALDVVMDDVAADHPETHVGVTGFTTKGKFGTLLVFFSLAGVAGSSQPPNVVWRLLRANIDRAEEKSARTCERCGAPGGLRELDDWLMTLCDSHANGHEEAWGRRRACGTRRTGLRDAPDKLPPASPLSTWAARPDGKRCHAGHDERSSRTDPHGAHAVRTYVVEMPRQVRRLFEGGRAACLKFIEARTSPTMTRLGLVVSVPRLSDEPDVVVCVPAMAFGSWEDRAAEVVAAWEAKWLLVESMPRSHRDEARDDLHHAVATALVAAAIAGVDAHGAPDDLGF